MSPATPRTACVIIATVLLMLIAAQGSPANELGRAGEPVVLTGVDVPALSGADPATVLAFRYDG